MPRCAGEGQHNPLKYAYFVILKRAEKCIPSGSRRLPRAAEKPLIFPKTILTKAIAPAMSRAAYKAGRQSVRKIALKRSHISRL